MRLSPDGGGGGEEEALTSPATCQPLPGHQVPSEPLSGTLTACLQGASLQRKTRSRGFPGWGEMKLGDAGRSRPLPSCPQPLTDSSVDLPRSLLPFASLLPPVERLHLSIPSSSGMALTVDVVGPAPWGFRITGGRDFHTPIMVTKVRASCTR